MTDFYFYEKDYVLSDNNHEGLYTSNYRSRSPLNNDYITRQTTINHQYYHQQNTLPNNINSNENSGLTQCQLSGASTFVLPTFPLRPMNSTHSANMANYSPSRFEFDKNCKGQFSWKCFSIILIVLTFILAALLAYFAIYFTAITTSIASNLDQNNCMLVQDMKTVKFDQMFKNSLSTEQPTGADSDLISTISSIDSQAVRGAVASTMSENVNQTNIHISKLRQQQPQDQQQPWTQSSESLIKQIFDLNIEYFNQINASTFWKLEYENKQSTFFRFNLTVPLGANFALYGRRNVAPGITEYDFVNFIKNGRIEQNHPENRKRRSLEQEKMRDNYYTNNKSLRNDEENDDKKHRFFKRDLHIDGNFSNQVLVNVSILQYLDTGKWFFSIYNDESLPNPVTFTLIYVENFHLKCPNDCSGYGACYFGKCDCIDGYQGTDCSKSICPILCSSHGHYSGGVCYCNDGWKGFECDIPIEDCEKPDCFNHGKCVQGICKCNIGWKGNNCDQVDCQDPNCSNHGICVEGKCYCKTGWHGDNCDRIDTKIQKCLPSCSDNGIYDVEAGKCICNKPWTGANCSKPVCDLDCGPHGTCDSGICHCNPGWAGPKCDKLPCDVRCQAHGQCKNGTCVCSQGWNGRYCTLSGCENGCSKHGQCVLEDNIYKCICNKGWDGYDCSVQLELTCDDEIDNDNDGMIDCLDVECCSHSSCNDHIMCLVSKDPIEVLLRKQPPSVTASFYQRMKFLIEESSVQSYAHLDEYTERRVSVMRGQVISSKGAGIRGVRVSVLNMPRFGFTVTREGGWYDILVNGGGAVTLQYQKTSLKSESYTMFVPWNRIVVLPTILMRSNLEKNSQFKLNSKLLRNLRSKYVFINDSDNTTCSDHQSNLVSPSIINTIQLNGVIGKNDGPIKSAILAESQALQETVRIPETNLNLVYQSSKSAGYLSTIHIKLTNSEIPKNLDLVHVRVEIEGSISFQTYEADPELIHIFAWNKRNVYKQKVYGLTIAKISIGYEYASCEQIVWEIQNAQLQGYDVDISDIGGWGVDIHHHYNFHEGILQRGDGQSVHFKAFPRIVEVIMGTGLRRPFDCPIDQCEGKAKDAKLLTPVALTSGPDGSLYVGDFNLIRRITPEGNVYTVLKLNATQIAYQYYLSISPADGHLYISDPEKHRILKVIILEPTQEPLLNSEVVVGNGEKCIPGDDSLCGDGGPALQARLAYPKGLAINANGAIYIADGTNIRIVDEHRIIRTIIGHHGHINYWEPIPCHGSVLAQNVQLQWPTNLDLSPLDGTLHLVDDRLILKLTKDMKIKLVAGVPLHCNSKSHQLITNSSHRAEYNDALYNKNTLGTISAIAFSPNGELYVAEIDSKRSNYIRIIDTAGNIADFAGRKNTRSSSSSYAANVENCKCKNNITECFCDLRDDSDYFNSNVEILLSSNMKFRTISALTVSSDGVLNIADQGSYHILSLKHYLTSHNENGEFLIPDPLLNEIYIFNRYGQHVATKDLITGHVRYSFLYSKNTSFGKLSTITDNAGNKVQFIRDYSNVVSSIDCGQHHKIELKISGLGNLIQIREKSYWKIDFDYDANSGLLTSRFQNDVSFIYEYNWIGRLVKVILANGEIIDLKSSLDNKNLFNVNIQDFNFKIYVTSSGEKKFILNSDENSIIEASVLTQNNSIKLTESNIGTLTSVAFEKHPLVEALLPIEAELFPVRSSQILIYGDNLQNHMSIKHNLIGDVKNTLQTIRREILVNNSRVLSFEYDQTNNKEVIYDCDYEAVITVQYDKNGLPLLFIPNDGRGEMLQFSYDRFNRLEAWKWAGTELKFSYNSQGLLSEIISAIDGTQTFSYNEFNLLSKISLASQREFLFFYDDFGGLRHVQLPRGTKHTFSFQSSIGFYRASYTPPGTNKSYLHHISFSGLLLQTIFPGDNAKVLYKYDSKNRIKEILYGKTKIDYNYSPVTEYLTEVVLVQDDFEFHWSHNFIGGLLYEDRLDFGSKIGLSNAKFVYDYDNNFRMINLQGRIGGQSLLPYSLNYDKKTGKLNRINIFDIQTNNDSPNMTILSDRTATFQRIINKQYLVSKISITIHKVEVYRMEFLYDNHRRISQTRTYTRNVGVNTYTNIKNYTWDYDGQLIAVESQEPWGFRYDDNGNMLSLTYRGNIIPMEYNSMDRIVKFSDGPYKYDNRGSVIQNARDERFVYNSKGLLIRALKKGRFDIHYFYDHYDRLIARKDNFGNVTQFFYTNINRPKEISHIYSPKDGKLITLIYDDIGHLIFAQIYKNKYYIATDHCGTPLMIFNQYGEGIREIMRSPYGHIVYDSNPYLYLPIDFCGGLLDQVTSLVHMQNGKVYDPLMGQWMTPLWENIYERIKRPTHLHLYRFNGNDPVNINLNPVPMDHFNWLKTMGVKVQNIAPQLFPNKLLNNNDKSSKRFLKNSIMNIQENTFIEFSFLKNILSYGQIVSFEDLITFRRSALQFNMYENDNRVIKIGQEAELPIGKGVFVSKLLKNNKVMISSVPFANAIYRDVYISVLNQTNLLPIVLNNHLLQQDMLFFVKEDYWKFADDKMQLKRLQGQVNTTFNQGNSKKNSSIDNSGVLDARIHGVNTEINIRYGTNVVKEIQRILHHAKVSVTRRLWHREKEALKSGFFGSVEWSSDEIEEILKNGFCDNYDIDYYQDVLKYPEFAEDSFSAFFVKKSKKHNKGHRKKRFNNSTSILVSR